MKLPSKRLKKKKKGSVWVFSGEWTGDEPEWKLKKCDSDPAKGDDSSTQGWR